MVGICSLAQVLWHELGYAGHKPPDFAEVCPKFIPDALRIVLFLVPGRPAQ